MQGETTKELLLAATVRLLQQGTNAGKLTARAIAAEAGVNLAMINYCFGGKDALVSAAAGDIIAERAAELLAPAAGTTPRQQLYNFLYGMCSVVMEYKQLTLPVIPHMLLNADIQLPDYVLPYIRQHFAGARSEAECRVIAFELVSFMQLIFYRLDDFGRYVGIDAGAPTQLAWLLQMQLDMLVPPQNKQTEQREGTAQ